MNTITLPLSGFLTLLFNTDESLTAARSELARMSVYKYAPARIVSAELAAIVYSLDPAEDLTHLQLVESAIGDIWMLWRKSDWIGSDAQRYERAQRRIAEQRANDTQVAKAARITATAAMFAEYMGSPERVETYRTTFAKMYFEDAGEDEAAYRAQIEKVVNPIFARRTDAPNFYIPLAVEILQRIEDQRNGVVPELPPAPTPAILQPTDNTTTETLTQNVYEQRTDDEREHAELYPTDYPAEDQSVDQEASGGIEEV